MSRPKSLVLARNVWYHLFKHGRYPEPSAPAA
jgi:hypothetical protein